MRKGVLCILGLLLLLAACGKPAGGTSGSEHTPTWQEQYDLGVRYLSEGNYQEAILAFTAAIEIDPKRAEAYVSLVDVYIGQGDTEKAMEILRQGLDNTNENQSIANKLTELEENNPTQKEAENQKTEQDTGEDKTSDNSTITLDYTVLESENSIEEYLNPIYNASSSAWSRFGTTTLHGMPDVHYFPFNDERPYIVKMVCGADREEVRERFFKKCPADLNDEELKDSYSLSGNLTRENNWFFAVACYDSNGDRIGYAVFQINEESVKQVKDVCMVTESNNNT